MANPIDGFCDFMASHGLDTNPKAIGATDRFHRFPGSEKIDLRNQAGWCKHWIDEDGHFHGICGDWSRDVQLFYTDADEKTMTPEELARYRRQREEARRQAELKVTLGQKKAAALAKKAMDCAEPAPADHPYLVKKGIRPNGALFNGGQLLISMTNAEGELCGLQTIAGDGNKRFFPGAQTRGAYHLLGEWAEPLYLVEGYATGCSIREATGANVVVAFTAGNLTVVAQGIRQRYPDLKVDVAGDNDALTKGNPGAAKARKAADRLGTRAVVPEFEDGDDGTDFNDIAQLYGEPEVRKQLEPPAATVGVSVTWETVRTPRGFAKDGDRVVRVIKKKENNEEVPICGPLWVSQGTATHGDRHYGIVVHWHDRRGGQHSAAFPYSRIQDGDSGLVAELSGRGLYIEVGEDIHIRRYLARFTPEDYMDCAEQLGWLDTVDGELAYIRPNRTIGRSGDKAVIFQPEAFTPSVHAIKAQGSLGDWQQQVGEVCRQHPVLVFGICAGLSAALLRSVELGSGGYHFYGVTSRGKTTLLQVVGSLLGCGASPADAPQDSIIRTWNLTRNASEGLAAAHNDAPLLLDEVGSCTARDFGSVIYDIAGGQGKSAMNSSRQLKEPRSWRVLLLSSGEVSASQQVEKSGRSYRGGMGVRLIDIPTGGDTIIRGAEPAKTADMLKHQCGQCYGSAYPAFVEYLIQTFDNTLDLARYVRELFDRAHNRLNEGLALGPEQERVLKRFALAEVAGLMAIDAGVLTWTSEEIEVATEMARDLWSSSAAVESDMDRAVEQVRGFILANHGLFPTKAEQPNGPVLGYRDDKDERYLLTPEGFKGACKGYDARAVAAELHQRGFLERGEDGRSSKPVRINSLNRPIRLYCIGAAILGSDGEE